MRETHVKLVIQLLDYRCAPKRMSVDGDLHQVCGTENSNEKFVDPRMFGGDIIGCRGFESGGGSVVSERCEQLTDRVDEANFGGPSRTDNDFEGLPLSRLLACGHVRCRARLVASITMPRRDDREFGIFCGREPSKEGCRSVPGVQPRVHEIQLILVILPYAVDCGQLRYPWSQSSAPSQCQSPFSRAAQAGGSHRMPDA